MACSSKTPSRSRDDGFRQLLPWLNGGRSYLQAKQQDFRTVIFPGMLGEQNKAAVEHTSAELVAMAKQALSRAELDIAEKHCSQAVRKQILENRSTEVSWQPHFCLGEVLETKAAKITGNSLEKQRLLLQAGALYNFVKNCIKKGRAGTDCLIETMKAVSKRLLGIENNLVLSAEGDPLRCDFDSELDKKELEELRDEAKEYLESLKQKRSAYDSQEHEKPEKKFVERASEIRKLCERISSRVKRFLSRVISQCVQVLGDPPCDYEVVVLGSLARDEMTPYSDLEWAILISSEEVKCKVFFRNLTNLVHLQIINLGETILPSMGIKALSGEWFYDNVTPRGISFDGFLPQACKTPLGNIKDFELIHCPAKMAEFQSDSWCQKNPNLADILLTVAPLESNGQTKLIEEYRAQLEKYLCSPCDLSNCHDNYISTGNPPCRGVCRGMAGLRKDFSRYEKMLPSIDKMHEDGKLYDVKKEIYRLVDRVFAGLASFFGIRVNGAFKILDELERNGIITSAGRENLASAAGIALELRIKTYLEAGKQGELVIANTIDKDEAIASNFETFYCLLNEEELFHIFFVATPLYKAIRQCCILDGNNSSSFAEQTFFDCSPAVRGHVYSRILKYEKALECYENALEENPEDVEMQLRTFYYQLELDRSAEMALRVEKQLEALIRRLCKKHGLPEGNVDQNGHFVPPIDIISMQNEPDSRWGLLRVLEQLRVFHVCQGNLEVAQHIADHCTIVGQSADLPTYFSLMRMTDKQVNREELEKLVAYLGMLVEEEGISTQSVVLLNELGGLLIEQENFQQAYQCLQRALAMERTLFISNYNPQTKITLTYLGIITLNLGLYQEGKVYYEELLQLRKSLNGESDEKLIENQMMVGILCLHTNHNEEAISYFKDVLALLKSDSFKRESFLECITHGMLAIAWNALNESEKALNSSMVAQECLKRITNLDIKVPLTCAAAADNLFMSGRHEDAVLLIKRSLEDPNSELKARHKAQYLKFLGQFYVQQGLPLQAEPFYREALDCFLVDNENTCAIVECLFELSTIMFGKGDSTEVKSLLKEAWKYASKVTGDRQSCDYIRRIGMLWVSLGDADHALVFYEEALANYKKSSALVNAPLFESELHINVGDMTNVTNEMDSDVPLSSEKTQNSQRVHYDRAEEVLQHQISLGNVNGMVAFMLVFLASKYSVFDFVKEEEKLLLEALEICKSIDVDTREVEAAALTALSDTKWHSGDHLSSFSLLERSLRIEMELNESGTNYSHIPDLLLRLTRLHLNVKDNTLLGEITERVLDFVDLVEYQDFPKENAGMCLWSAFVLYSSLDKLLHAYNALERANELFNAAKRESTAENELQAAFAKRLFTLYPYSRHTQELIANDLAPLAFPGATDQLVEAVSSVVTRSDDAKITAKKKETSSREAKQFSANSIIGRVVHNVTTKLFEFLPSDDGNSDLDSLLFDFREEIVATETQNIMAKKKKQSKRTQNFEERIDMLHKLAENVNSDLKTGNILQASRTIRGRLKPFVVSLFQNNCPENIDPAEYLFNEALEAKKSHESMMMLVYLHLTDSFPSQPQTKAKISKMRGDCNMSERNYRTAALCFVDAANCYAEAKTPCVQTEHLEVLTELARSHMLCDDYKAAWKTCQEGMHLFGASVSKEENFLPLQTKLFSQAAQCLMSLATADHELEEVVSICKRGLVSIEMLHCSTRPKELVKYVKLNYKLRRCLVTALSRLNKVDESRKIAHEIVESLKDMAGVLNKEADVNDTDLFLVTALTLLHKVDKCKKIADVVDEPPEDIPEDIACVLDEDEDVNDTDLDADDLNICCCLYSWIGQAQILCGDNNAALIWLAKSLSKFLASGLPDTISMEQEFVELLDAITVAKVHFTQSNVTAFEETIELCMQILLKITDGVNMLPRFFEVVAKLYVDRGGEEAAVMLHERALSVVDCTGNFSDVKKARDAITTLLGHCHRRQSIKNTGKGTVEERNLAEKFYQLGLDSAENIPLKISYVGLLYDQECFEEADKVLRRIISENDELWDIQISFSYSSRILCSPGIKRYIEDHGECVTTAGILAYNLLVHVCVALGRKKEAVATCKKLSEKGEEVEVFVKSSSVMKYVLGSCQKALATLIDDQCFLKLENTTFPLSDSDLDILYSKLDEWTPALDQSEKTSVEWLSGELDGSFCCDIDSPTLPLVSLSTGSKGDTEEDLNIDVLEMIHAEEGIFDKPFVTQKAILKRWTIGDFYNVYETLGTLMCARGRLDGAIECYEYCLGMDEDYSHGKDLAAAVAELYQVKAMTALNEDKALYTRWMREAEECFNKLRLKEEKMDSFVARAFGSFLCRQGRFAEAITQFQNILDEKSETKITITSVDNLLISVYLQREVEARGKLILPLEILVYHEMVPAFLKLNKVDNAQESVQQMEKQVKRYRSAPEYALILSVLGYTHNDVGNTKKAKDIFLSVLQIIPGHKPVIDALET